MDVFVRRGDSFWRFSQIFRIPLQLILHSNRTINPAILSIGQRIQIPGFVAVSYQVQAGDSLWLIAQRRNSPLDSITLVNAGIDPSRLFVGQTIRVALRIAWRLINGKQEYDRSSMMTFVGRLLLFYPFIQI